MKTRVICILDRSGSMASLAGDVIGGYNQFVKDQKEIGGKATLTTVLFDDKYTLLCDNIDMQAAKKITEKEYFARGTTALLDAIGKTLTTVESTKKENVIVMIHTDGFENSSQEYTNKQVKKMVDKKTKNGWKFVFLGANVDAFDIATGLGISVFANYSATADGVRSSYGATSTMVADFTNTGEIDESALSDIE